MIRALFASAAAVAVAIIAAPTACADPYDALWDLMPGGYDDNSCGDTEDVGEVAGYDCFDNSLRGGPGGAHYGLFADLNTLGGAFKAYLNGEDAIVPCPAAYPSPDVWHQPWAPNEPAGQIACGVFIGVYDVIWTRDSDLFFGVASIKASASQTDRVNLIAWWRQHGTVGHDLNSPAIP